MLENLTYAPACCHQENQPPVINSRASVVRRLFKSLCRLNPPLWCVRVTAVREYACGRRSALCREGALPLTGSAPSFGGPTQNCWSVQQSFSSLGILLHSVSSSHAEDADADDANSNMQGPCPRFIRKRPRVFGGVCSRFQVQPFDLTPLANLG